MVSQDTSAEFRLTYDGDALTEHTMDVRDLAPSLIAFGELFTRANTILNGEDIGVSLKVRANPEPGSFELVLILAQAFYITTQFLTSDLVTSAANLLTIVTGIPKSGENLFGVFKKLKGQKSVAIQQPDGVTLKASNIELHISNEVFRLYKDNEVKRLSQAVVEPLFRTGIDKMIVKDGERELESITKEDAPSFTSSNISEETGTENIIPRLTLRLVSPTFDLKHNKWKLDDGGGSKWYGIEDEKFLNEVRENKRRFGMGDYLICRVKTVQRMTEKKLEIDRAILLVLEQQKAGEQLSFNSPH